MDKSHLQLAAEELDAEIRRLSAIRDSLYSLNGSRAPEAVVWARGSAPAEAAAPKKASRTGSSAKAYWAAMSPLQRKREMARRQAVAEKNRHKR